MSFSVVILSKNAANVRRSVDSIREAGEDCRVIVVDDGLKGVWRNDCTYLEGRNPFIFSRNANLGIWYAREDVILMNDDATLKTRHGFTEMVENRPLKYGLVSPAVTENVGNLAMLPKGHDEMRDEARVLVFIAVLIPWVTYQLVGGLDERFTAYGWDDNDYCRRVRLAGLKLGIWDRCLVGHDGESSFRGKPEAQNRAGFLAGQKIYQEKWGTGA